jgi:hypothetical protein
MFFFIFDKVILISGIDFLTRKYAIMDTAIEEINDDQTIDINSNPINRKIIVKLVLNNNRPIPIKLSM